LLHRGIHHRAKLAAVVLTVSVVVRGLLLLRLRDRGVLRRIRHGSKCGWYPPRFAERAGETIVL
jgi:hypothetical protein